MFSPLKQLKLKVRIWSDLFDFTPANDPKLVAYGDYAYSKCVEWFGPVQDSHWNFEILYAFRTGCIKSPFRKCYSILISRSYNDYEMSYEGIGHEMYHRVTGSCKGLRQIYWLDEMLAFLTARHLLYDFGLGEYSDYLVRYYQKSGSLSLKELTQFRQPRGPGSYKYFAPDSFASGLYTVGIALETVVGWEHLCRLVRCRTWEQWLSSLPDAMRQNAHRLLLPAIDPSANIVVDTSKNKRYRRLKSRSEYPQTIIQGKPITAWEKQPGKYHRKAHPLPKNDRQRGL